MSKFKVGDIVRVKKDLVVNKYYGPHFIPERSKIYLGEIAKIKYAYIDNTYVIDIDNGDIFWPEETLEPLEKTLENLEVGDVIVSDDDEKTVLGICGKVYLLSSFTDSEKMGSAYTAKDLTVYGYKLKDSLVPEEMTLKQVCDELGRNVKIIKE